MIDALFGSKTRVKLLHLFLNNPDRSFYVREITRLIDEQINSVRRELANMLEVGIINSDSADNKLYYGVDQKYEHFEPLRQIFAGDKAPKQAKVSNKSASSWNEKIAKLAGIRVAIAAGKLVRGSASQVDLLLVGNLPKTKVAEVVKAIEKDEGRELNYAVLPYEEFYYRLSVRDKFVAEILSGRCSVLVDTDQILTKQKED